MAVESEYRKKPTKRVQCSFELDFLSDEDDFSSELGSLEGWDMEALREICDIPMIDDEDGNVIPTPPSPQVEMRSPVIPAKKPRMDDVNDLTESFSVLSHECAPAAASCLAVDSGHATAVTSVQPSSSGTPSTLGVPKWPPACKFRFPKARGLQYVSFFEAPGGQVPGAAESSAAARCSAVGSSHGTAVTARPSTSGTPSTLGVPKGPAACKFLFPKARGLRYVSFFEAPGSQVPGDTEPSAMDDVPSSKGTDEEQERTSLVDKEMGPPGDSTVSTGMASCVGTVFKPRLPVDCSENPLKAVFSKPIPSVWDACQTMMFSQASWVDYPRPPPPESDEEEEPSSPEKPPEKPKRNPHSKFEVDSVAMQVSRLVGRRNAKKKEVTTSKIPAERCTVELFEEHALIILPRVKPLQRPWKVPLDPAKRKPFVARFQHPRTDGQRAQLWLKRRFEPSKRVPFWVTLRLTFDTVQDMEYVAKKFYPYDDLPAGVREDPPLFDPFLREHKYMSAVLDKEIAAGKYSSAVRSRCVNSKKKELRKVNRRAVIRAHYLDYLKISEIFAPNEPFLTMEGFQMEIAKFLFPDVLKEMKLRQERARQALALPPEPRKDYVSKAILMRPH